MKLLSLKSSGLLLSEKIHRIIALLIPNRRAFLMSRKNQRLFRQCKKLFPDTSYNFFLASAVQIGPAIGFAKKRVSAEQIGNFSLHKKADRPPGVPRSGQNLPFFP